MKKMLSAFMVMLLTASSVLSQEVMAFELPDFGELASEAASGISDVASGVSDAAGQAGDFVSEIAGNVGSAASEAANQAGNVVSGFASQAGEVLSDWGKQAGETADDVKEQLSQAGVVVKTSADQLGDATVQKASELTEQVGKGADEAINAVSSASNYVVDQAGHVVDLAAVASEYVSDGAMDVIHALQDYGTVLMGIAEDAVSEIDLSKRENWETAQTVVYKAIDKAYDSGLLDRTKISEETMRTAASIVFGALMYGYQYQNNQITLSEYVSCMSEVLIREGLPTGVAYLIRLLPIKFPHADSMARDVTYYIISVAYGDKTGEEIEEEEKEFLEEAAETETE